MAKPKACKKCRFIHKEEKCPQCGGASTDSFKGKIEIVNAERSVIAKNLKLVDKGVYAIKAE